MASPLPNALFLEIAERSPTAILLMDKHAGLHFANESARALLGLAPPEIHTSHLGTYLEEDDASLLRAALQSHKPSATSRWLALTLRARHQHGERSIGMLLLSSPTLAESGLWVAYCENLTRRQEAESLLRVMAQALDHVDDTLIITDKDGHILHVNRAFERRSGYTRAEVIGQQPRILKADLHSNEYFDAMWQKILEGHTFRAEMISKRKSGEHLHEMKTIVPIKDHQGALTHHIALGQVLPVGELSSSPGASDSERHLQSLYEATVGLWEYDLRTKEVRFSPHWRALLGYRQDELSDRGDDWAALLHPDDRRHFIDTWARHLAGKEAHFELEHRMMHKDGSERWMLTRGLVVRDDQGQPLRLVGYQTDISERKRIEQHLHNEATKDPLTGLPNRAQFISRLKMAMSLSRQQKQSAFAVFFMDLDRFKIINDSMGHLAGDELLRGITARLQTCLRPSDLLARLGGDEFAVLLEGVSQAREAVALATRILTALAEPFIVQGREVFTTSSIGIAMGRKDLQEPDDILRDADTAMYHAKAQGRSRAAVFDSSMRLRVVRLLELETDLRKAMDAGQFSVYFQPICDLDSLQPVGFEALLRWLHPERGFVSPPEFIRIAEDTGLINDIGLWVLRAALRQVRLWQRQFGTKHSLSMSVNLSGVQFLQLDLPNRIDMLLREHGLDPGLLRLEITESVIMDHAEYADAMLAQLKAQGVRISIDDFGTGYASMSYLRRYPIDTVKVDQSFVAKMGEDADAFVLVKTVVNMARNLGMDVIAEGIETQAQLTALRQLGCTRGQGFLLARPMSAPEADAFLAQKLTAAPKG